MKRLITYYNKFRSDEREFSSCGTVYTVYPILVDDNASNKELREIAKRLELPIGNFKVKTHKSDDYKKRWEGLNVTHSIELTDKVTKETNYIYDKKEVFTQYVGFITLPSFNSLSDNHIKPIESLNNKLPKEALRDLITDCEYFRDIVDLNGEITLIIENWAAYHIVELLGYQKFDLLLEDNEIESSTFSDEVFCCDECYTWDYNDNGYTYNYRWIGDHILVGTNCGCYDKLAKENLDEFINNPDKCLNKDLINELLDEGTIEEIETFIGGMVDGRGGYIYGKSVREGQPHDILKEVLNEDDSQQFLFGLDDVGQFQTYFTLYKVK